VRRHNPEAAAGPGRPGRARHLIKLLPPGVRGVLADPYTGQRIIFARGGASEVDIDHVVALSEAWQKGAARGNRASD